MRRRELVAALVGAAAWPPTARAQPLTPVIGWLSIGSSETDKTIRLTAFRAGLNEIGFAEGQNVVIEYRWAAGQSDRLPSLAADLVRRQVTVIVGTGATAALAAKKATTAIPIVFNLPIDPVQFGLVHSLSRPSSNITGVTLPSAELAGKRLELLHDLLPSAGTVVLLVNSANPVTDPEIQSLQDAARSLALHPHVLRASTAREIEAAEIRAGGLVVSTDPVFSNQCNQIVELAARRAVPAIYGWRLFPAAGGLMSYGPPLADTYRLCGVYAGKILKGAQPSDLPVEQLNKVELVINLQTAKQLGLTIPLTLLGRADEVIE